MVSGRSAPRAQLASPHAQLAAPRAQPGFTLMEIMVGMIVLALALFTFTAYASGQRKGLNSSNHLADGTRAAASALQSLKGQLGDSLYFKTTYDGLASRPRVSQAATEVNGIRYDLTVTLTRAPAPLYGIKARAVAKWGRGRTVELGLLCPGATDAL